MEVPRSAHTSGGSEQASVRVVKLGRVKNGCATKAACYEDFAAGQESACVQLSGGREVARGAEALNAEGNRRREHRGVGGDTNHGGVAVSAAITGNSGERGEAARVRDGGECAGERRVGTCFVSKAGGKLDAGNGCVVRI